MSNGNISPATPVARLCHIVKWDDFDGYGFNLHAEKGKPGQFIGKVDDGSPAEAAGLKEGDRIVEVNGVNIANENHKQVVQRIKAVAEETKLLVVDAEADKHFKSNNVVIKSSLPGVVNLKTPVPRIAENGHNGRHSEDTQSSKSENEIQPENSSCKGSSVATTPSSDRKRSLGSSPEPSPEHHHDETDEIPTSVSPTATNGSGGSASSGNSSANGTLERVNNSLNLNMTAAELRAQLAARKNRKFEVKRESIDFKQKYEIIQKL